MENFSADKLIRTNNMRYWETVSVIFVTVMLLLQTLFINSSLYIGITEAKWYFFLSIGGAYIALCILGIPFILGIKDKRALRLMDGQQKLSLPQIFALAYFALSCISALLSEYGAKDVIIGQSRYEGLLSLFLYLGVFFCLSFWGEYNEFFFYIVSITSMIIGVVAILQLFGSKFLYPEGYNYYSTYFLSTLGNIDLFSGVISITLPILLCSFILLDGKYRYIFAISAFVLSFAQFGANVDTAKISLPCAFVAVLPFLVDHRRKACRTLQILGVITASYGLYKIFDFSIVETKKTCPTVHFGVISAIVIGAGIIMLLVGTLLEKRSRQIVTIGKKSKTVEVDFKAEPSKIRKYIYITILACVVALFVFLFVYTGNNLLLHDVHEALHLRISDEAGSYRGTVYKDCIELISKKPLFGTGPGTFAETHSPYHTEIFYDFAHCDLLNIAVCQGLPAMLVYIAFIVSTFVRALKNAHKFYPIIIMCASMVGYLLYSFFNFSIAIVSPTFWIMIGIMDKTVRQLPE